MPVVALTGPGCHTAFPETDNTGGIVIDFVPLTELVKTGRVLSEGRRLKFGVNYSGNPWQFTGGVDFGV